MTEALRGAQLLLLVDNLEHLVAGSALLGRLLTAAPELHVLVTSRVPLHLYGEHQFRVPPLTLPEDTGATESGRARQRSRPVLPAASASRATGSDTAGRGAGGGG